MHKLKKSKERRAPRMYLGLGLIAAPAVVSGAVLSSAYVFAGDSAIDIINLDLPLSCSVYASGMNSHTATVANGTYTSNIGTTTMNIACNDNGGFSVYATGFTNNVIGETISNKLVGTSVSGNATIDTGTATGPGVDDESNWAMKLAQDSGATYPVTFLDNFDSYHAVPGDYTKVATRTSATDAGQNAEGATITSTYAAYISKAQYADDYSGQVKYTLVYPHNAPAPVALYLQNTDDIADAVQNVGDTAVAMDIRDGKEYTVGKLADQRIWLLDNLALDLTMPGAKDKITAANTHASDESLNALFNGVPDGGDNGNLARTIVADMGGASWSGDHLTEPLINAAYSNTTIADLTDTPRIDGDWSMGVYYNYCAASAGNYCYDYSYIDADEDICPAGWRLPTGGYGGEYEDLYSAYQGESDQYTAFRTALRAPYAGYDYFDVNEHQTGSQGYFWTSMNSGSSGEMHSFIVYDSDGSSSSDYRGSGLSIRCIMGDD